MFKKESVDGDGAGEQRHREAQPRQVGTFVGQGVEGVGLTAYVVDPAREARTALRVAFEAHHLVVGHPSTIAPNVCDLQRDLTAQPCWVQGAEIGCRRPDGKFIARQLTPLRVEPSGVLDDRRDGRANSTLVRSIERHLDLEALSDQRKSRPHPKHIGRLEPLSPGMTFAVTAADSGQAIPVPFAQVFKRTLLGRPLVTAKLKSEKLSNAIALGTVAPDPISSSCYGTEQVLLELVPAAGMAAFALLLPVTGVILLVLALVAASYRQVVMAYTQAGGSYVVARENFGPRVAQVAAAALLIDYVVTVAVQTAAGTVAVVSAIPVLGPYSLEITVGVVILICYMNLRGVREAGRPFAVATYSFVALITLTIVAGVVRNIFWGGLTIYDPQHTAGVVSVHHGSGLVMGATILVVLRAFANGGSSLTGVEAISNSVNVFREPQGVNARRVITAMACILGFLLAGVSYLAYVTHATPYRDGYPSVLSQEARAVFGHGLIGNVMFILVQASSAAILYTGANGSFSGFPALASFVAEDQFLPRQLMKRGHRLVFSNGIIVLTALSVALLVFTGGSVNALVPLYAIGVFIGFSMAGYGMTKHHLGQRESGWRRKLVINLSAGIMSTIVVGIFVVAKFTEGAWLIAVVFPVLVFVLMRLNGEYRAEAAILKNFRTDRPELVRFDTPPRVRLRRHGRHRDVRSAALRRRACRLTS